MRTSRNEQSSHPGVVTLTVLLVTFSVALIVNNESRPALGVPKRYAKTGLQVMSSFPCLLCTRMSSLSHWT